MPISNADSIRNADSNQGKNLQINDQASDDVRCGSLDTDEKRGISALSKLLERAEMRMLRWILGVSLRDRRRNKDIREVLGVVCITDKVREAGMRWYGHVMRMEDGCCIKRIMNAEVYGRRSRVRQKKRWRDKIQEDLKTLKLKKEDADDRNKWRRRIRVADPSPRRD